MGSENWSLTAKICDSCKSASATVFCRADSAFLCLGCDCKIHAANKLASRHARVWVCEVCEQAPASITCKADAAALCVTCDRDIHSANPLARRHERFPIVPFYDSDIALRSHGDDGGTVHDITSHEPEEEAEAASWLLTTTPKEAENDNNNNNQYKSVDYNNLFNDMDSYLDMDIMPCHEKKPHILHQQHHQHGHYSSDGVVPVQNNNEVNHLQLGQVVDGFPTYEMDFGGSKPYLYNFNSQSISQSVSSSSMDVGVVPDHSAMADVSNTFMINTAAAAAASDAVPKPVSGVDREARVLRYREKRKNRKFEKTIRYASRKAYAETRPRIKGRFAKRTETELDSLIAADASYGVVPSF
ncbi:hypothetical protein RND71_027039 [Anisodus tanguticus]|uniref:Uncharacterized protein n=1 Tax=Anisodus tanguticus TaxID=243964 RepID=A0AAE1RM26_9SOLA|nr:hypothetical protein RND71_027039 [Anisodus tanguticus]